MRPVNAEGSYGFDLHDAYEDGIADLKRYASDASESRVGGDGDDGGGDDETRSKYDANGFDSYRLVYYKALEMQTDRERTYRDKRPYSTTVQTSKYEL